MIRLGGVTTFQWKTTEQVWPFEKAEDGSTLYCKIVNLGTLPSGADILINHGISNITKVKRLSALAISSGSVKALPYGCWGADGYSNQLSLTSTQIYFVTTGNYSGYTGRVEIIYAK